MKTLKLYESEDGIKRFDLKITHRLSIYDMAAHWLVENHYRMGNSIGPDETVQQRDGRVKNAIDRLLRESSSRQIMNEIKESVMADGAGSCGLYSALTGLKLEKYLDFVVLILIARFNFEEGN